MTTYTSYCDDITTTLEYFRDRTMLSASLKGKHTFCLIDKTKTVYFRLVDRAKNTSNLSQHFVLFPKCTIFAA